MFLFYLLWWLDNLLWIGALNSSWEIKTVERIYNGNLKARKLKRFLFWNSEKKANKISELVSKNIRVKKKCVHNLKKFQSFVISQWLIVVRSMFTNARLFYWLEIQWFSQFIRYNRGACLFQWNSIDETTAIAQKKKQQQYLIFHIFNKVFLWLP